MRLRLRPSLSSAGGGWGGSGTAAWLSVSSPTKLVSRIGDRVPATSESEPGGVSHAMSVSPRVRVGVRVRVKVRVRVRGRVWVRVTVTVRVRARIRVIVRVRVRVRVRASHTK